MKIEILHQNWLQQNCGSAELKAWFHMQFYNTWYVHYVMVNPCKQQQQWYNSTEVINIRSVVSVVPTALMTLVTLELVTDGVC